MSKMDNDTWQRVYLLFDPMRRLQGETLKYFVSRNPEQLQRIATELDFADDNHQSLFVGQRGSGKSSELRKLAEIVDDKFLTVVIDVDELTDLFNVNHVEVLYLMGVSIYGAAAVRKYDLNEDLLRDLIESIQTLVREQTEQKNFTIDLPTLLKAIATGTATAAGGAVGIFVTTAVKIFEGIKFSLGVSDKVVRKLEIKPQIAGIVKSLNNIIQEVQSKSGKRLLVIVDGLDRVEFEQARSVFAESEVLSQPHCHLIYVIPSHLYYSPHLSLAKQIFQNVNLLPNIKLHPKGNEAMRYEPGYKMMEEVVDERLKGTGVTRQDLFSEDALNLLIKMSGGLMREFIRLVRSTVLNAVTGKADRGELDSAEASVSAMQRDYMAGITDPLVDELISLTETGLPSGTPEGDMLLQNLYILCQSNKELWYEVHPILSPFIQNERNKRKGKRRDDEFSG